LYPNIPIIGIDRSIARLSKNKKIIYKSKSFTEEESEDKIDTENTEIEGENTETETDSVENMDDLQDIAIQLKPNAILLRAELSDFFSLVASKSDWIIHSHYLLYPNPYPKKKHLQRRWHGHPIFPIVLILGGNLIVRSNWRTYCEEMKASVDGIIEKSAIPDLKMKSNFRTFASNPKNENENENENLNENEDMNQNDNENENENEKNEIDNEIFKELKVNIVTTHFEKKYVAVGLPLFEVSFDLNERTLEERLLMLKNIPEKG
jgi:tRNA G46 methylase TrmB